MPERGLEGWGSRTRELRSLRRLLGLGPYGGPDVGALRIRIEFCWVLDDKCYRKVYPPQPYSNTYSKAPILTELFRVWGLKPSGFGLRALGLWGFRV